MDTRLELLSRLSFSNDRKILLIIIDGLGGLAHPDFGDKTELQYAKLPNLDNFVRERQTVTGLIYPVGRGITPGSGSGHLALFGYDPIYQDYKVGRGALEAADLDPGEINRGDITARLNFCTLNEKGEIIDRRAGRLADGNLQARILNENIRIKDASVKVISTKEHRGIFILRNDGHFSPQITDTDPEMSGLTPLRSEPLYEIKGGTKVVSPAASRTADVVNEFSKQARNILKDMTPANGVILRSFSVFPNLPNFNDVYSLNAAAISAYPLYRGIARLIGMTVLPGAVDFKSELELLEENYEKYDFFFLHYKNPDSRGEDGDFPGKVKALEEFDELFPKIRKLKFNVVAITGDHSTPAVIGGHSHHSVPIAINSDFMKGYDQTEHFDEAQCIYGSLGRLKGTDLMTILLANAKRLRKFEGLS
jgi:2,3-bisphosphoglycerate-independent phosphoglycerate mutase